VAVITAGLTLALLMVLQLAAVPAVVVTQLSRPSVSYQ